MVWRSPYREEPPQPRSIWPTLVSRGVLLAFGIVLAYVSMRGLRGISDAYGASPPPMTNTYHGRTSLNVYPIVPPLLMIGMGLLGGTMIVAALLPVKTMQKLFERWHRPPVTGDRGSDYHGRWWHWSDWW